MPARLFSITMGTGLALSVDPNSLGRGGQLILATLDKKNKLQQWQWCFIPAQQGSMLYHPGVDLFAAPNGLSQGAPVILQAMSTSLTGANTFEVLGAAKAAIRPPADTKLNLNALGPVFRPGAKVALWAWCGGDVNEVWTSTVVA